MARDTVDEREAEAQRVSEREKSERGGKRGIGNQEIPSKSLSMCYASVDECGHTTNRPRANKQDEVTRSRG